MSIFRKNIFVVCFVFVSGFLLYAINVQARIIVPSYQTTKPLSAKKTDIPRIKGRASWENTGNLRNLLKIQQSKNQEKVVPRYYNPSKIIIYNYNCNIYLADGTRNPDCDSNNQDAISIIQNIYRYHVLNRGFDDIGYNFIISWNGDIFEGRYGGNGAVGFYSDIKDNCANYNIGTISILLLGNIDKEKASIPMEESLTKLIAWLSMANNINPTSLNKTTKLWQYNKEKNRSGKIQCNNKQGSFALNWTGPTISYYKNIRLFNGNYGLNINKIRVNALKNKKIYQQYSYRTEEDDKIWTIVDGKRKIGGRLGSKTITIENSQLEYFPQNQLSKIQNRNVFFIEGRANPYILKKNKCYEIISKNILDAWKLNDINPMTVNARNIPNCSFGDYLSYPAGSLIRARSDNKVYFVNDNGSISHVSSLLAFKKLGFDWANVIVVNDQEITFLPKNHPVFLPTGTLVQGSGPTVYLISQGTKKPISNHLLLTLNGFSNDDIMTINDSELAYYKTGSLLTYPSGTKISFRGNIYTIFKGRRYLVVPSMEQYINSLNDNPIILSEADGYLYPPGLEIREKQDLIKLETLKQDTQQDFVSAYERVAVSGLAKSIKIGISKINKNTIVKIFADQSYKIQYPDHKIETKKAEEVYTFIPHDINGLISFLSITGNTVFNISYDGQNKQFLGNIKIVPVKINNQTEYWIVNHLLLEDYLQGINLPNKIVEANVLKALSIANRSYAMYYINSGGRYGDLPFDIMAKEHNVTYNGFGENKENIYFTRAINETSGIVLFYNTQPALTIYCDNTCGVSKDATKIFGSFYKKFPYLSGGIYDPVGTKHTKNCFVREKEGVGMSLAGAQVLAVRRGNYIDILQYYYPGTNIKKLY